jgi:hypothetical protein
MAYQIITSPPALSSAHMPIYFTVYDNVKPQDETNYENFKYLADVYINAVLVARLKVFPEPVTLAGVFDIGPVIRNYFESKFAPSTGVTGNQYKPYISVQVKFGQEYNATIYTNLITDVTRNYFDTYKAGPYLSTAVVTPNAFATNRPETVEGIEAGLFQLVPYIAASTGTLNYSINGVNGSVSVLNPSGIVHFNLSHANTGGNKATLVVNGQTKIIKFKCENRFPTRTLAFLNSYGGYETYDFTLISKERINIKRKEYERSSYRLAASGVISYQNSNVYHTGRQVYATRSEQSMTVTSDYLDDDMYRWLGELVQSPEVYLYDDGYWIPVQVQATEYEYKTHAANRLTVLELNIRLTGDYNTQYR